VIVLDENLDNAELREALTRWHGAVRCVTDPEVGAPAGTDDLDLPRYLRKHRDCVFVTLDKGHFFQRIDGDVRFCLVELAPPVANSDVGGILLTLRRVLAQEPFNTARKRNGLVLQVGRDCISYHRERSGPVWALSLVSEPRD